MIKVLSVFGTWSEAIKLAPVIRELQKCSHVPCSTQHHRMLDQVLRLFGIVPDCPSASSGQALRWAQPTRTA
jgi:UDP-N-acetylglucosamine 2-epimerase